MSKRILVISPTPSHPQNTGSRARIYGLLTSLKALGHEVYFLQIGAEAGGDRELMQACWGDNFYFVPYTSPQARAGLAQRLRLIFQGTAQSIDARYDPGLDKVLGDLARDIQFDVVMVEYVFFSKALDSFGPGVLKLIDTIDIFSNRHERMSRQGLQPTWYSTSPREEARGLKRADIVIAISAEDHRFLSGLTHRKVITIGHSVPLYEPIHSPSRTEKMLFVGSANPMNAQAIRFFADEVLPRIREQYPAVQLLVAGGVGEMLEDRADWMKMGGIDDLRTLYTAVDLVINPMLFGTGVSIKSLEALGQARPLVTTSIGARGLEEGVDEALLVADTPAEFSAAIMRVLSEAGLSEQLSANAGELIARWNKRNLDLLADLLNA